MTWSVVPFSHQFAVRFTHARHDRVTYIQMGWFRIPLPSIADVRAVYNDWRLQSRIEHGYRFGQEQGLDVEDMRVQTLERMKRLFILVLAVAQFIFYLIDSWPDAAVQWIRFLGGKLGLDNDLDGPYPVLRGLAAFFQTVVTLSFLALHPFPRSIKNYGSSPDKIRLTYLWACVIILGQSGQQDRIVYSIGG